MDESKSYYLSFPFGRQDTDGFSVTSYTGNVVTRGRSRTWVRTPGFRMKNKWKSELPINPYSDIVLERKLANSKVSMYRADIPGSVVQHHYGIFGYEDPPSLSVPNYEHDSLVNKALGKIPSRINGTQFNLPLFMFEWSKTAQMVTDLATDIANRMKKAGSRREVQNVWLEYRYGWRLLIMDIYDALRALHDRRLNRTVLTVKAEATSHYDVPYNRSELQGTRYMLNGYKTSYRLNTTWDFGIRYSIRFKESSATLGTLQQFGVTNPIGLIWELIPYSFVLDWLIPVSDYLSQQDTWIGKSFVSGSVCYWQEVNFLATPYGLRDPLNPGLVEKPGAFYGTSACRRRAFRRVALTAFPKPNLPNVQLSLNTSRMLDAVSLITQRTRHPSHKELGEVDLLKQRNPFQ